MGDKWLAENFNKFDKEEVTQLNKLETKIRYSLSGTLLFTWFTQLALLERMFKNNPGDKNPKFLFLIGIVAILPITTLRLAYYPFKVSEQELVGKLKGKYS